MIRTIKEKIPPGLSGLAGFSVSAESFWSRLRRIVRGWHTGAPPLSLISGNLERSFAAESCAGAGHDAHPQH
jgi:hypothetical protein